MPHLDTVLLCQLSKEVGEAAAKDAGWGETGLGVEPPPTEKSEKVDEEDRLDWPGRSSGRHPALAAPLAARAEAPVGLSSTCSQALVSHRSGLLLVLWQPSWWVRCMHQGLKAVSDVKAG